MWVPPNQPEPREVARQTHVLARRVPLVGGRQASGPDLKVIQVRFHLTDTSRMEPELSLTCQVCGRRFASALQVKPKTFESMKLTSRAERCPFCRQVGSYLRTDYYFYFPEDE